MKLVIVGGRLQAMEAVCLAQLAGYDIAIMDRDPQAPAADLEEAFYPLDLLKEPGAAIPILRQFDLILPATEDLRTLRRLQETSDRSGIPLAFDPLAYGITSSKIRSNRLFRRIGIPMPRPWPECGFPAIFKPSASSGSSGIVRVNADADLKRLLGSNPGEHVIQAYLDGPSYSLEVLGHRGGCVPFLVVRLEFDAGYDCKRVVAGPNTGADVAAELSGQAGRICAALQLNGIMDIEVIQDREGLKVLEIDARLPSQTPMAVYFASGVNLLEKTVEYWMSGKPPADRGPHRAQRAVILEHLQYRKGRLGIAGEHVLARAKGLRTYRDFFGAHFLLSNFESSPEDWAATAVFVAADEGAVRDLRERSLAELKRAFKVDTIFDPSPPDETGTNDRTCAGKTHRAGSLRRSPK